MIRHQKQSLEKGSVVLVALCFMAVLGIALASYLAVSSQAVKLSNRAYIQGVSEQLAESGLERALWSLNNNNWDSSIWTITGTTAKPTNPIAFPSSKYGNGVTGSINLRIDHYKAAAWNPAITYDPTTNDMVWYRGVWFQCTTGNLNQPPPNSFWLSVPAAWSPDSNYNASDIVLYRGTSYKCLSAHTNQSPPNATYWTNNNMAAWSASTNYVPDDVAIFGGTPYRCRTANSNQPPPNANYWAYAPAIYAEGTATLPDSNSTTIKTQLRATITPAPQFPNCAAATSLLDFQAGGIVDSYNSVLGTYNQTIAPFSVIAPNLGYSAILAGGRTTGTAINLTTTAVSGFAAAPPATTPPYGPLISYSTSPSATVKGSASGVGVDLTRFSRSPFIPNFSVEAWNSSTGYRVNDVVRYGANLYVCIQTPPNTPPTNGAYWTANTPLTLSPSPSSNPIGVANASIPSIYYINGDLVLDAPSASLPTTLTINGPVILDIRGELKIRNSGQILVKSGGSAEFQVSDRISIGGSSAADFGISNETRDPKKLILVGTATSTSLPNRYFSNSSAPFPLYGVIYMPNATNILEIKSAIYGAISAPSVRFSTAASLHYDTSLRAATFRSLEAPFIISEWRELTDQADRLTLP